MEEAFNIVMQDGRHANIRLFSRFNIVAFQATAPVIDNADYGYILTYNTRRAIQKSICTNCGKMGHTF